MIDINLGEFEYVLFVAPHNSGARGKLFDRNSKENLIGTPLGRKYAKDIIFESALSGHLILSADMGAGIKKIMILTQKDMEKFRHVVSEEIGERNHD